MEHVPRVGLYVEMMLVKEWVLQPYRHWGCWIILLRKLHCHNGGGQSWALEGQRYEMHPLKAASCPGHSSFSVMSLMTRKTSFFFNAMEVMLRGVVLFLRKKFKKKNKKLKIEVLLPFIQVLFLAVQGKYRLIPKIEKEKRYAWLNAFPQWWLQF